MDSKVNSNPNLAKYVMYSVVFLLLLEIGSSIGRNVFQNDESAQECSFEIINVVDIAQDSIYVDPITVGTTTDPENL